MLITEDKGEQGRHDCCIPETHIQVCVGGGEREESTNKHTNKKAIIILISIMSK